MKAQDAAIGETAYQSLGSHSLVPTSFNPDDAELRAFPRPLLWEWASAAHALSAIKPAIVMMRAPLFWQLEQPLWRAARSNGAAIFVNDQENMPLGRSAMANAGADTIVTGAHDALAFSAYLKEKRAPFPRGWIVVQDVHDLVDISRVHAGESTLVFQEMHLFPGLPVLVQCGDLARSRNHLFHAPTNTALTTLPQVTFSSPDDDPIPLSRIKLPIQLQEAGTCTCSKATYKII